MRGYPSHFFYQTAMGKEKIFISHAAPADNYFAAWLAAKLKLLGYDVWVELDELKFGDAFWPGIEDAIRNQSVKFLVVISKNYLEKVKDPFSGVFKELSCADRVKIQNFKSPIRLDDVSYDDFPVQVMGLSGIDFHNNWGDGLDKLLASFKKEQIPCDITKTENPLNFWLDAFKVKDVINQEEELIYTNWFAFNLPEKIYIHKPVVSSNLDLADIVYPYLEYNDRHICFFPKTDYPTAITCALSTELTISAILNEKQIPIDDFLVFNEPRKKIVELLNKVFKHHLIQNYLKHYQQANNEVFYYPSSPENRKRISLKSVNKTNVAITGKTGDNTWSFGISHYAVLYPFPYFKIGSHIIFQTSDLTVLDQEEQTTLRKTFGFDWYNRDWLDTLLGMMIKVSGQDKELLIKIPINGDAELKVSVIPHSYKTDFGYYEPSKGDANED